MAKTQGFWALVTINVHLLIDMPVTGLGISRRQGELFALRDDVTAPQFSK